MLSIRRLAICTTGYDTAHESVADQVQTKIADLCAALDHQNVEISVFIGDDGSDPFFAPAARAGAARIPEVPTLIVPTTSTSTRGRKGKALRAALAAAVSSTPTPDAFVYLNLNLKVPARCVAAAVTRARAHRSLGGVDVVVGSRSPRDGGTAKGTGAIGALKSRVWSSVAHAALPQLRTFADPNAPLKLMSERAARMIVSEGNIDGVGFDAEWLCLWLRAGLRVATIPMVWEQRAGSRPPWELVPEMLSELAQTRRKVGSPPV